MAACEAVGAEGGSKWTSVQSLVFLTDDDATAEKILAGDFGTRSIAGTPDRLVEAMGQYGEQGFDEFIVPDFNLGTTPEARREALERINDQVVSQVN
jgi:alkanesulfonate monooxygenase SsuD/methylene tetrahydromethanopterin reductase-like flavin-dependent oxidoreductase (luciferase family)